MSENFGGQLVHHGQIRFVYNLQNAQNMAATILRPYSGPPCRSTTVRVRLDCASCSAPTQLSATSPNSCTTSTRYGTGRPPDGRDSTHDNGCGGGRHWVIGRTDEEAIACVCKWLTAKETIACAQSLFLVYVAKNPLYQCVIVQPRVSSTGDPAPKRPARPSPLAAAPVPVRLGFSSLAPEIPCVHLEFSTPRDVPAGKRKGPPTNPVTQGPIDCELFKAHLNAYMRGPQSGMLLS
jgi:hypothetical protein